MDISENDLEAYLYKIFVGYDYRYVQKGSGEILLKFKHPDIDTKVEAQFIYDRAYKEALSLGMLPVEKLAELIDKRQIFSEANKKRLSKLESQLEAQQFLLSKTTKVKANRDRIKEIIGKLTSEITELRFKKTSKLAMSVENKAEEERSFFLCSACTHNEDGILYWPCYQDALNETDLILKDNILYEFIKFYGGINTTIIRELARSNIWRIRYINSQKTSDPLFGVPTSKYTVDMLHLTYWSSYYQNIYEMLPEDRPSDLIIEDDTALDAFMKSYYEERNREDASRRSKHQNKGQLSAFNNEEVIVTRSNELYEDIEYNKPREAQRIKDRADIKKRTKKG